MKAPVWALITHIDLTGSSSGYHRYYLVDDCIRHFSDWWLLGYKDYDKWGFMMFDLCNQFVVQAVVGGLLSLVAYILIFSRSFGAIGRARKRIEGDRRAGMDALVPGVGPVFYSRSALRHQLSGNDGDWLVHFVGLISVVTSEAKRPAEAQVRSSLNLRRF